MDCGYHESRTEGATSLSRPPPFALQTTPKGIDRLTRHATVSRWQLQCNKGHLLLPGKARGRNSKQQEGSAPSLKKYLPVLAHLEAARRELVARAGTQRQSAVVTETAAAGTTQNTRQTSVSARSTPIYHLATSSTHETAKSRRHSLPGGMPVACHVPASHG